MTQPTYILGAGGHGKVVADVLNAMGREIRGFLDADPALWGSAVNGIPVLGGDDVLSDCDAERIELANGIGSVLSMEPRRTAFEHFKSRQFRFVTVRHPSAIVSSAAKIEEGAQIMAGAIVQPSAVIGANTIVNTGALVDHDCVIGMHCHLAPGCTLSGNVWVGEATHIGTGATVIQGVRIGTLVLVAAGAVVMGNIADNKRVYGVPAKEKSAA